MAEKKSYTIVEYFGGGDGHRCGYCKNEVGNFSHGMWSHTMTVQDYQDLIDRGWRRSGKYVYKPIMHKTCCPQYSIRCHALKFQPSKSHKKILKKVNKFLSKGDLSTCDGEDGKSMVCDTSPQEPLQSCPSETKCPAITDIHKEADDFPNETPRQEEHNATLSASEMQQKDPVSVASAPKPGTGADPNKPPCRKAKDMRKERRLQKEQIKRLSDGVASTVKPSPSAPSQTNQTKSLEDFIKESLSDDAAHSLEVRLVHSNPPCPQFKASFDASYKVYKLYQMAIHKDPSDKPSESQVRGWGHRSTCSSDAGYVNILGNHSAVEDFDLSPDH